MEESLRATTRHSGQSRVFFSKASTADLLRLVYPPHSTPSYCDGNTMSGGGFKIASRFREAAQQFNEVPVDQVPALVKEALLSTSSSSSSSVLAQASCYIFEQAAFTQTNPEALYAILLEAGFDEAHGKAIGRLWAAEAPAYLAKLKQKTLGGPTLVETDYHLNLVMGESTLTRLQEPTALFEFCIDDDKKVGVEFSHDELSKFFGDLERIQHQLDALS